MSTALTAWTLSLCVMTTVGITLLWATVIIVP